MPKNDYVLSIDCDWVGSPSQYQDILSYFTEKVKDVEEVFFSGDHQFHYPHIPSNTILVNIDHHHDMGYKDFQYKNMEKGLMDEASWVLALIRLKKIKGYIWISNYESEFDGALEDNLAKVRQLDIFKRYFDIKDISEIKYNKILVCESYDWSKPGKYVYYSLIALAKEMNKKVIFVDNVPNTKGLLQA